MNFGIWAATPERQLSPCVWTAVRFPRLNREGILLPRQEPSCLRLLSSVLPDDFDNTTIRQKVMGDLATMFHPLRDDACAAQRLEQLLHGPLPLRTVVHLQGSTTSPHLGFPLCEVTNLHRLDTSLPVYPPGQSLSAFVRGQRSLVGRNGFRAVQRRGLTGCSLGKLAGPEVAHALLLLQCLGFALFARKLGPVEQPYGRLWGSLFTELFATVLVHAIFIAAHAQDEVGSVLARIAAEGAHPELAHGCVPLPSSLMTQTSATGTGALYRGFRKNGAYILWVIEVDAARQTSSWTLWCQQPTSLRPQRIVVSVEEAM